MFGVRQHRFILILFARRHYFESDNNYKAMINIIYGGGRGTILTMGFRKRLKRVWYIQSTVELTRISWLLHFAAVSLFSQRP